jgi:undecaprenyl diphosphate synthase
MAATEVKEDRAARAEDDLWIDRLKKGGDIPRHVAIIMDGNGRWAKKKGLPRIFGHRQGVKVVRPIVTVTAKLGIEVLTLYAFSTENWKRPRTEISGLMKLLKEYLKKETNELKKNNVRLKTIGHTEGLTKVARRELERAQKATEECSGLVLNLALNYSGRKELTDAVKEIATGVKRGEIYVEDIDEQLISQHIYTRHFPDPDLLVRTSGEFRVSNFLLWQIAYSEIYVTETLWPDFGTREFFRAIQSYQTRERRYGDIGE